MATLTHSHHEARTLQCVTVKKVDQALEKLLPRRCMVISVSLILAGLGIPVLMVIGFLPINLLLGLLGFALTATGGVLALTLCGEI